MRNFSPEIETKEQSEVKFQDISGQIDVKMSVLASICLPLEKIDTATGANVEVVTEI